MSLQVKRDPTKRGVWLLLLTSISSSGFPGAIALAWIFSRVDWTQRLFQQDASNVLQPAPKVGQTVRQYAAGLLTVREQGLRKVQTGGGVTISSRVFYNELKEGICKIIDVNMILFT